MYPISRIFEKTERDFIYKSVQQFLNKHDEEKYKSGSMTCSEQDYIDARTIYQKLKKIKDLEKNKNEKYGYA